MSCSHCNTKFKFFVKEAGCANCGLVFCNKCVKQKCKIPNKGNIEQNVCRTCYSTLNSGTSNQAQSTNIPPPDTFLKRLETLETPALSPITMYTHDTAISALRSGLTATDQKILDRLERLKDEGKGPPPTESELRRRLANLRGENDYVEGPSKLPPADTRTDQQKANSLLEQFTNERDIELTHNPQDEIEARLATLREQGVRPNEGPYVSNLHESASSEEEEENEVSKITRKIMDEVAIEARSPATQTDNSRIKERDSDDEKQKSSSPDELPWCVLCNNDAVVRCLGCGGDLYCSECNSECHRSWGETDHKVIPFKPK